MDRTELRLRLVEALMRHSAPDTHGIDLFMADVEMLEDMIRDARDVPDEPTEAMITAGLKAAEREWRPDSNWTNAVRAIWAAMLAEARKP